MGKLFSTCQLVQQGSDGPELLISDVNLNPGSGFSVDHESSVLLAGGFSAISPEAGLPLSPTLFLNHALTPQSEQQLLKIAKAEFDRIGSVSYRSYTVDMDNRLCVLGDDALTLHEFMETYGGILDITPLLVKGYDPDIPTVTELQFDSHGESCRLHFKIRSAIDLQRCTYCGDCGKQCPENCIDENLFVDFGRCTFCKECESVCSQDAVDIHGAIFEDADFPAVMLVGDVKVEADGEAKYLYYEKDLPAYFASLYPSQVDEVITHSKGICQYNGNLDYGCDLCVSSCGHGAITKGPQGIAINTMLCQECGACVSACPTGAMQNERFNDRSFYNFLDEVELPEGGSVVLGDDEALHRLWWTHQDNQYDDLFFFAFNNIGSLSLFHFLELMARGVGRVIVLKKETSVAGEMRFLKQVSFANSLIESLYGVEAAIAVSPVEEFDRYVQVSNETPTFDGVRPGTFVNRRVELARSLSALAAGSGKEVTLKPDGYVPFATVSCNENRCTHCMACLNDCKIKAMQADTSTLQLKNVGSMCVGCGLCVRVCPEDALSISSEFTLGQSFFDGVVLAQAEPMACKSCGKVFGTKKSFERVMAILQKKEAVDVSHFEYCEDCRVKKLFETENT